MPGSASAGIPRYPGALTGICVTLSALQFKVNCQKCGREFPARRSDARYCSDACRQAAYRQRVRPMWLLLREVEPSLSASETEKLRRMITKLVKISNTEGR
jgi:hypothetical protein